MTITSHDEVYLAQATAAHARAGRSGLARLWDCVYAQDRRGHRHRCQCCNKIVRPGEEVVMYRFGWKTRVVHATEAGRPIFEGASYSYRDLALTHAYPEALR